MIEQIYVLTGLSLVTASISWTVTQEEIFREPREYCARRSREAASIFTRKFFYVFICEYCFSHWVCLVLLILTNFRFLYDDLRGSLLAFFVIPWLANQWMSLYRRLRVEIKHESILAAKAKDKKPDSRDKTK